MSGIMHLIALTIAGTLGAVYLVPPSILVMVWTASGSPPTEGGFYFLLLAWAIIVVVTIILHRARRLDTFISFLLNEKRE
jgi:hypothetical protein